MKNDEHKWIESAESDLELAKTGKVSKKIKYDTLCFHSQQSVEKSLKAILIFHDKKYPRTHNIKLLFDLLNENNIEIPKILLPAIEFSKYTGMRYPDDAMEIDSDEYNHSIVIATKVLKWAKSIIIKKQSKLF